MSLTPSQETVLRVVAALSAVPVAYSASLIHHTLCVALTCICRQHLLKQLQYATTLACLCRSGEKLYSQAVLCTYHAQDLMRQETTNAELASLVTQLQQKSEEDKHALEELAIIKVSRWY